MDKKQKKELLVAVCSYLPYGLVVQYTQKTFFPQGLTTVDCKVELDGMLHHRLNNLDFKPYLRPMDSMTEEEKKILSDIHWNAFEHHWNYVDFCNKHHLDYRGLIPKGLALPATDGMYDTYKYFPPEYESYAEYVEYLKSEGLAAEAPQ